MAEELSGEDITAGGVTPVDRRRRVRRAFKIGCLALLLTMCGCFGTLFVALLSGPVTINLPGGAALRLGSDDFVLKDYSFRDGTTYFVDLNSGSDRHILEFRYTDDDHHLDVVVHHADRTSEGDTKLLTLNIP